MLKDMGVQGVKVQEVYGLDEEMLAILPQPVHALIFLFRYRDVDESLSEKGTECPDHVWFANQIPDFACATVALLNIVNNIKGLKLGKELRDFKDFTQDMNPMSRGEAIDSFEFVRRIHNSFARENDLLIADMHCRAKANRAKKKQAAAKARETKEAKKVSKTPLMGATTTGNASTTSTGKGSSTRSRATVQKSEIPASDSSSPLSDPPDSDPEFETPSKRGKPTPTANGTRRRSSREPKPRKDPFAATTAVKGEPADEEGFHFIAYMPIAGHVWRMDGLDSYPQDMGAFESGEWMSIAQPALQTRMALYEGADIEFNLMAVVHDPVVKDWEALVESVRTLRAVDTKLDGLFEDWRALDGAETGKDVVLGCSAMFGITEADVEGAEVPVGIKGELEKEEDLLRLVEMRKKVVCEQAPLRGAVRDAKESSKGDEEKARHRRHDYGKFIRSWLGALADNELLAELLEDGI
jgi:ubiquitin carboxyl-terminal hydrolase L5